MSTNKLATQAAEYASAMAAPHTIWIITGTCGEYSDRSWWVVCWRQAEVEARAVVEVLKQEAAAYKRWEDSDDDGDRYGAAGEARRAAMTDPHFESSYTGATYRCQPIATDARAFFDELQTRQGKATP